MFTGSPIKGVCSSKGVCLSQDVCPFRALYPLKPGLGPAEFVSVTALFSALAIVLSLAESSVPGPLPFFRFGFANIAVLAALVYGGPKMAFFCALLKVSISSIITGRAGGPLFFMALGGTLLSFVIMAVTAYLVKRSEESFFMPSITGISIFGSFAHTLGQLCAASVMWESIDFMRLLAWMSIFSAAAGLLSGIICVMMINKLIINKPGIN
jgi:heptaprenyl diphosphate synthase